MPLPKAGWRSLAGLAAAAFAGVLALVANPPSSLEATGSVWQGVYAEAQAQRGAAAYAQSCQKCHGANLTGIGEAKPLAGPLFLSNWNGLTLGDLFERIRTTMPLDSPRSLSRADYADTLAYLLKVNGFPAGPDELPGRAEVLAAIRIDAFKAAAASSALFAASARAAETAAFGPNDAPDPYREQLDYLKPPSGRSIGSTSGVAVDARGHIWVADRCGANSCAASDLDPIMEFDAKGAFIKAFGRGLFLFPHGLSIDPRGRIWVTDGQSEPGRGAQVICFDPSGKVLMRLGKAGVSKAAPDSFSQPNAVLVTPQGTIFVADGHEPEKGVARIVVFDARGHYLREFGAPGAGPGQFDTPHSLAMDSRGRLFVADRWNNRVDIFSQDGRLLAIWPQFGRPSGVFVDDHDRLYVSDSESRAPEGYGHHPGWRRGIRIGDSRTGRVEAFIPDTFADPDSVATSGPEGLAVGRDGVIWAARVGQKGVVRYALTHAG